LATDVVAKKEIHLGCDGIQAYNIILATICSSKLHLRRQVPHNPEKTAQTVTDIYVR
jgi:hypothetical protein